MGFCLLNNVAVTAAALAARGERVVIVDWDAHHGNGTQDCFYADPRVLYVSMHEFPLYPGTGRLEETGAGDGDGRTVNFPFPAGTTGDAYLAAVDDAVSSGLVLNPDVASTLDSGPRGATRTRAWRRWPRTRRRPEYRAASATRRALRRASAACAVRPALPPPRQETAPR